MLVKFKTMSRYGVTRYMYRSAVEGGKLAPAKTKIVSKYPRFWSWDVERCFAIPVGTIQAKERKSQI
jgi:hypothetical protein